MQAFATGCGGRVETEGRYRVGPSAFYGVTPDTLRVWQTAQRSRHPLWYVDHGYFQRGRFWRVTRGAQQCDGLGAPDYDRLAALGISIKPWRPPGRHVLVCLQSDWWYRRSLGFGAAEWTRRVVAKLQRYTERPIVLRHKPTVAKSAAPDLVASAQASFRQAIEGAHAVVTYQSNAAVDAICAGVPAYVTGECAAVPMASGPLTEIEHPKRPDGRERWAAVLAANQWTIEEIANGEAWKATHGDR